MDKENLSIEIYRSNFDNRIVQSWFTYFEAQVWYDPDKVYSNKKLSEIEKRNIKTILKVSGN